MQVEHFSFDLFVRFQQFGRPLRTDAFHGSRDLFYLLSPSQRARRLSLWIGKSWDLGMHLDHVTRARPSMQLKFLFKMETAEALIGTADQSSINGRPNE